MKKLTLKEFDPKNPYHMKMYADYLKTKDPDAMSQEFELVSWWPVIISVKIVRENIDYLVRSVEFDSSIKYSQRPYKLVNSEGMFKNSGHCGGWNKKGKIWHGMGPLKLHANIILEKAVSNVKNKAVRKSRLCPESKIKIVTVNAGDLMPDDVWVFDVIRCEKQMTLRQLYADKTAEIWETS